MKKSQVPEVRPIQNDKYLKSLYAENNLVNSDYLNNPEVLAKMVEGVPHKVKPSPKEKRKM